MHKAVMHGAKYGSWPVAALLVFLSAVAPSTAQAQDETEREMQESRLRLEEIQNERRQLQTQLNNLRSQVRDVSAELQNIERQISASRAVMREIDFQVEAVSTQVTATTAELARNRTRLVSSRRSLHSRLRGIYKRGPLDNVRVLLGAESFADLINRYRALHTLASIDRTLVDDVSELQQALIDQNADMQEQLAELTRLREAKVSETAELERIERGRQSALRGFRSAEASTQGRLVTLDEQQRRLTSMVDDLERRRTSDQQRRVVAGETVTPEAETMSTADIGQLNWPVEGSIVYRFGRHPQPDGIVLRWNGIGIGAPVGTPVRAVRAGTVLQAGPFEGYGPSVVVSHGGGFYTLYLYLNETTVTEGVDVVQGQTLGTVGGADTPEGPHIEFQVRMPMAGGTPQAVDPLDWLRSQR